MPRSRNCGSTWPAALADKNSAIKYIRLIMVMLLRRRARRQALLKKKLHRAVNGDSYDPFGLIDPAIRTEDTILIGTHPRQIFLRQGMMRGRALLHGLRRQGMLFHQRRDRP